MNEFLKSIYGWADFIGIAMLLILVYFGLKILKTLLDKFDLLGSFQKPVRISLHYLLLVFEPLTMLILMSAFIMVDPRVNGLIVLLTLILGANYFKNYISGRFVGRDSALATGKRLAVKDVEGVIYELELFGVQLQTARGRHFVSYSKLLSEGYTILGGEEVGGILRLIITANGEGLISDHKERLADLLTSTPYLDRIQKPILDISENNPNQLEARIAVKEVSHLSDLRALFNDWGYSCQILKTNRS